MKNPTIILIAVIAFSSCSFRNDGIDFVSVECVKLLGDLGIGDQEFQLIEITDFDSIVVEMDTLIDMQEYKYYFLNRSSIIVSQGVILDFEINDDSFSTLSISVGNSVMQFKDKFPNSYAMRIRPENTEEYFFKVGIVINDSVLSDDCIMFTAKGEEIVRIEYCENP